MPSKELLIRSAHLEFENNRELYDWVLDNIPAPFPSRPHQYEFARLDLQHTVMSKRKLLQLVENKFVSGWDDPRLPTIAGLRRRGCTPESIRKFCELGRESPNPTARVEMSQLDFCLRDDLNTKAPRVMAVLRPLKVIIDNYPEDQVEWLDAPYWPHDIPKTGSRKIAFSRELYIEKEDFLENPSKDFFRLAPGLRSPTAICLLHHLHPCGKRSGNRRSDRRTLHVRSRNPKRQRSHRTQSERNDSLGLLLCDHLRSAPL